LFCVQSADMATAALLIIEIDARTQGGQGYKCVSVRMYRDQQSHARPDAVSGISVFVRLVSTIPVAGFLLGVTPLTF
jgi:hypothetical protein